MIRHYHDVFGRSCKYHIGYCAAFRGTISRPSAVAADKRDELAALISLSSVPVLLSKEMKVRYGTVYAIARPPILKMIRQERGASPSHYGQPMLAGRRT